MDEVLSVFAPEISFEEIQKITIKRADVLATLKYAAKLVPEERVGNLRVAQ